jgi:hypothetical protein
MVLVPTTDPNGWIARADGAASAEVAEDFPTTLETDKAAMLVAYTLLGAAINGFVPYLSSAGGIRSSCSTRVPHVPAPPVPVGHRRHPTRVAALFRHRLCT